MPRLHSRAAPTFQLTGWVVEAGLKCTVTLTGQSAPGLHLPVFCTAIPVIGPACRPASTGTAWGRCRGGCPADCLEGWAGTIVAGAAGWPPLPSDPTIPAPEPRSAT